jgi:uncharacterized membrane-anchored protein
MRHLSSRLAHSCLALIAGVTPCVADVAPEPTEPTIVPVVVAVIVAAAAAYFTYQYFRRRRK